MSGRPRCASRAPSRRRTSPCTIDCGCTTTSMRSYGTSNSQCASMTSRPLFMSVAESIVMRAPIVQVGMPQGLLGRDVGELGRGAAAERTAARGHDQGLDRLGLLAREQLVQRGVLGVDRQQLRAAARQGLAHERAAGDEALLVGERDVDARLQRRQRGVEPGRADDGVEDDVRPALGCQLRDARRPSSTRRRSARAPLRPRRGRPARSCARRGARPRARRPRRRCPRRARRRADPGRRRRPGSPAGRSSRCCRGGRRCASAAG